MKKKILCFLCFLTLLFAAGCSKEGKKADPTPTPVPTETPTPTPTPAPENLAKANLDKIPAAFDGQIAYQAEHAVDTSNGIGYDMNIEFSINQDIMGLLGYSGLETISLTGSMDIKDILAGNFTLGLNSAEVLNMHLFTDYTNVLFNLPKYSSQYAAATLEELLNQNSGDIDWEAEDASPVTGILSNGSTGFRRTLTTIDPDGVPTNEEMYQFLSTYLTRLVDCFKPQTGIEKNVTIGTGDYVITGDKHTVIASAADLQALAEEFQAEAEKYPALSVDTEDFSLEGITSVTLNYYAGADGSYAWECCTDSAEFNPAVFVSTTKGFCLYSGGDEANILMYSVITGDNEGTILIPSSSEDSSDIIIDYVREENALEIDAVLDSMELSAEYSLSGETVEYSFEIVTSGMSILFEETADKTHVDATITVASYGMKVVTVTMTTDLRDYVEIPVPTNTTDIDTWAAELDTDALLADFNQLMTDYPFLADLFNSLGDDTSEDIYEDDGEPFVLPEDYTDDFMNMTGYYVDADGFVDFNPPESEVLAAGKPSTGLDTIALTDDKKQALIDCAAGAFTNCYSDVSTYYFVWGSIEFDNVYSYYYKEYYYTDENSDDNYIFLNFDAVSGEFSSISFCTSSREQTLKLANEALQILGADYTITPENAEDYVQAGDFWISGYDGGSYFSTDVSVWQD